MNNSSEKHVFTYYMTNEPNILNEAPFGGDFYGTLSDAIDSLRPELGYDTVWAITFGDKDWWSGIGEPTYALLKEISRGVVFKA